ncbi:MAG: hypothetical protein MH208_17810 [Marinobacter sp.]|nr:hypothetical protein [Marinobacter sp.]
MKILKVMALLLEYPNADLQRGRDELTAAVLEDSRLPRKKQRAAAALH